MVRLSLTAALLAAVGVTEAVRNSPTVLPGAYIVEYEDSHVSGANTRRHEGDELVSGGWD